MALSSNPNFQLRSIAARSRRGDTSFTNKSGGQKWNKTALDYIQFNEHLRNEKNKFVDSSVFNPTHDFFIWAHAEEKYKKGKAIPAPIVLPQLVEIENSVADNLNEINNFNTKFNVYPIPASEEILILVENWEGSMELKLYNLSGQLVYNSIEIAQNTNKIKVSKFNNGIYYLMVLSDNELIHQQKVSVQH